MPTPATQPPAASTRVLEKPGFQPSAYRFDIQGLRTVAVLMVVLYHAGLPVPGGFVGVDMFFVISGFVITAMLMREWQRHGRIRFARFYARRFKRLIPALALVVIVVSISAGALLSPFGDQEVAAQTGIGAMLLGANFVIAHKSGGYFGESAEANPLVNIWSLSVEEQFYLGFPLALFLVWRWSRRTGRPRHRTAGLALGAVGVASFALAVVQSTGADVNPLSAPFAALLDPFYSPLPRVWEFTAGTLLALAGSRAHITSPRLASALGLAGMAALVASLWLIDAATPWPGLWTLLPVLGTTAVLAAGTADTALSRFLSTRPMVALGDLSYSIYLWHWPFVVFARTLWPGSAGAVLVAAALSFVPAWLSFHYLEEPIRRLPQLPWPRFFGLVALTVGSAVLTAGALLVATSAGWWNPTVRHYQAATEQHHPAQRLGCSEESWKTRERCAFEPELDGAPVYLVGDSNADHFTEGLRLATTDLGRPLQVLSEYGCGLVPDELTRYDAERERRCATWDASTREYLAQAPAGTVVLANSYLEIAERRRDAAEHSGLTEAEKLTILRAGLTSTIEELRADGHEVLLVDPVPLWGLYQSDLNWSQCSVRDVTAGACRPSMPITEVEERQGTTLDVVHEVAEATGTPSLDLAETLCRDGACHAVGADGTVQYRDGYHISVERSRLLAGRFEAALARIG